MKSIFFVLTLFLFSNSSFAQKQRYIQFYGNPLINSFRDVNKVFTQISSPNILVNYDHKNSSELGLIYRRKFENKISWGAGLGWRFDNYSVDIATIDLEVSEDDWHPEQGIEAYFIDLEIDKLTLRFHFSYHITDRLGVGVNINAYSSVISSPSFDGFIDAGATYKPYYATSDSVWQEFNYDYNLDIRLRGGPQVVVPELFFTSEIFKGLNLTIGAKLGFMGRRKTTFDIMANGVFSPESGVYENRILHQSAITMRDVSYFFGFTYDLPLFRKK